jgi:hypothetical protein
MVAIGNRDRARHEGREGAGLMILPVEIRKANGERLRDRLAKIESDMGYQAPEVRDHWLWQKVAELIEIEADNLVKQRAEFAETKP